MCRYDFLGIYLSVAYVLLGITSFIVCSCVEGPSPENVTGPSGSDMVCVFYFGIQLLVWIPIGCVLVALNVRRYQTSNDGPFFDVHRHWIGLVLGVVLLGNSYLALDGEGIREHSSSVGIGESGSCCCVLLHWARFHWES